MARRRSKSDADRAADALGEILMQSPWWAGPIVALAFYLTFRFLIPPLIRTAGEPIGTTFGSVSAQVAPLIGLAIVVIWLVTEVKKWGRRRLLDTRSDTASLRELSWQEFEQLVGEAYRRKGYVVEERGGGGADGGVDLVLRSRDGTVLVQCKQWKTWKVGVKIVRELFGVMAAENASRGIVVTCGVFTKEAIAFAEGKQLQLVDGPALWELVGAVKAGTKISNESGQGQQEGNALVASAPATTQPSATDTCPKCGSPMVSRTARKGRNAGSRFLGCSRYPQCRGTREIREPTS